MKRSQDALSPSTTSAETNLTSKTALAPSMAAKTILQSPLGVDAVNLNSLAHRRACRPFMDATSRRWCHATGHFTSRGARWRPAPSLPRACWHALSGRPPRTRRRFRPHTSTAGPAHRVRPATRPSAAVVNFLPFSRGRGGAAARDRRFHQRGPLRDQGPGLRERDSALGCLIRPPGGAPRRLERARTHVFAVLGA